MPLPMVSVVRTGSGKLGTVPVLPSNKARPEAQELSSNFISFQATPKSDPA